jgi:predicted transcriptional regulator
MQKSKAIIYPVRLTSTLYKQLEALAARDERTRCGMIRKLIADAARHLARSQAEKGVA